MPKFRQRYKPPVEGVKIQCSEATYKRLKTAALASWHLIPARARDTPKRAIGYLCEASLTTALEHEKNYPLPAPTSQPAGKVCEFQIGETLDLRIEQYCARIGRPKKQWIASVILYVLSIEETRQRGVEREPDRFR